MLEAKDTPAMETIRAILETEKEISFKAGRDSITKLWQDEIEEFYNEGRQAGIKEVVEWIEGGGLSSGFLANWSEWQAKLKEWGIE